MTMRRAKDRALLEDREVRPIASRIRSMSWPRLSRIVRRAPEVIVKVTSSAKTGQRMWAHLTYITRNGKETAENEAGDSIVGLRELKDLYEEWDVYAIGNGRRNTSKSMHVVLSMPENTPSEAVRVAARRFAAEEFGPNHQYVFALHTDTPRPHVHLVVKVQGYNGKAVSRTKADLQRWRGLFARRLRELGVEAEATPRRLRGLVRRPTSDRMYWIQRRDHRHSHVWRSVAQQAERSLHQPVQPQPWDRPLREFRAQLVAAFEARAREAEKLPNGEQLARDIRRFVATMPAVKTRDQEVREVFARLTMEKQWRAQRDGPSPER